MAAKNVSDEEIKKSLEIIARYGSKRQAEVQIGASRATPTVCLANALPWI